MKTRLAVIVFLLLALSILLGRNEAYLQQTLLEFINPIKQRYNAFIEKTKQTVENHLFQKEAIVRLRKENLALRKRLLEQTHYLRQIKDVYDSIPHLRQLPVRNLSIVQTISYVKLNSFSQIILTKPIDLKNEKLYGLIQGETAGGVAVLKHGQLYGYLISDPKCRFAVHIGNHRAPGIAIGKGTEGLKVQFIPKWHDISVGDEVTTSGYDDTFFEGIPVGKVTHIELESAYKVAYVKPYADTHHPKTFFLINDPRPTLLEGYDRNSTLLEPFAIVRYQKNRTKQGKSSDTTKVLSSIPMTIDQTKVNTVAPEPTLEEVISEHIKKTQKPVKKQKKQSRHKPKRRKARPTKPKKTNQRPKPKASTLDLF